VFYFGDYVTVINASGQFNTVEYYAGDKLVAERKNDSTMNFYHPDHLGSTSLITNSTGGRVEETVYEPFGSVAEFSSAAKSRFDYTGKETDDTGLQYFGARFYNPAIGKWTQPDTLIQNIYDPQALNRYAYVSNNPFRYADKDGHWYPKDVGFGLLMLLAGIAEMATLNPIAIMIGIGTASTGIYFITAGFTVSDNNPEMMQTVRDTGGYTGGGAVSGGLGLTGLMISEGDFKTGSDFGTVGTAMVSVTTDYDSFLNFDFEKKSWWINTATMGSDVIQSIPAANNLYQSYTCNVDDTKNVQTESNSDGGGGHSSNINNDDGPIWPPAINNNHNPPPPSPSPPPPPNNNNNFNNDFCNSHSAAWC
jgi:RHS repeat-associated protein